MPRGGETLANVARPTLELRCREVWTSNKGKLGACVRLLPHDGVARAHPLELGVVDAVDPGVRRDEVAALLARLGREALHVVEAHGTVGRARGAHVLEVVLDLGGELVAQPVVEAPDVGDVLHDLHADGAAEHLSLGLALAADLDDPRGLATLVREQTKLGHKARDGAEQLDDAGVAVAARAQHRVGKDHGTALRPAEDVSGRGAVADLGLIARAGERIAVQKPHLAQLCLVVILL